VLQLFLFILLVNTPQPPALAPPVPPPGFEGYYPPSPVGFRAALVYAGFFCPPPALPSVRCAPACASSFLPTGVCFFFFRPRFRFECVHPLSYRSWSNLRPEPPPPHWFKELSSPFLQKPGSSPLDFWPNNLPRPFFVFSLDLSWGARPPAQHFPFFFFRSCLIFALTPFFFHRGGWDVRPVLIPIGVGNTPLFPSFPPLYLCCV